MIMSVLCARTYWRSRARVLGEALGSCFGVHLTIGPT